MDTHGPQRLLFPIEEAADVLGIGRSKFYVLMAEGKIETVKIGKRTLVPYQALTDFVQRLRQDPSIGLAS